MNTLQNILFTSILLSNATSWAASYPPNIDYGSEGDFITKRGTEFGRTADLGVIGPVLVNLPEAPGSSDNGVTLRSEDTVWDLSDLTNPTMIRSLTCPTCFMGMPIDAHATVTRFVGDEAYIYTRNGNRESENGDYLRFDPNQPTSNEQVVSVRPDQNVWPASPVGYTMQSSPYASNRYWDYDNSPSPTISIRDREQNITLANWA